MTCRKTSDLDPAHIRPTDGFVSVSGVLSISKMKMYAKCTYSNVLTRSRLDGASMPYLSSGVITRPTSESASANQSVGIGVQSIATLLQDFSFPPDYEKHEALALTC